VAFRTTERGKFRDTVKAVQDLDRLVARAALGTAGPRDFLGLKQSMAIIPRVRTVLGDLHAPLVCSLVSELDDLVDVRDAIDSTILEDAPALARDGGVIRDGVDTELDELRAISRSGKQVIAEMETRERARTGISSLKVRYNRVFGYYIEISKSNLGAVPPDYHRKQTIAGGERFITPALKEYEEKVLGADERILERELEIFEKLRCAVAASMGSPRWRKPPPPTTTSSRTSTTATNSW
jgi:DNA mismatch repair protein MutS